MVDIYVGPSTLKGNVIPPPSKSIAHRALIAAVLAAKGPGGMNAVKGITADTSQDIGATMGCLATLFSASPARVRLNCRESGTTLRFMIPLAAALGKEVEFTGAGRLAQRPLTEYSAILAPKGVELDFSRALGSLPLTIRGRLRGGSFSVPGHISSQYISGLLLSLPLLEEDSSIVLSSPLQSAPYVDLTLSVLEQFGVKVIPETTPDGSKSGWRVPGRQSYTTPPGGFEVEGDYSQGAFWLVAEYIGQPLTVIGLNPASLQGDRAIVDLLRRLAQEERGEIAIDVSQFPDLVPVLTVAACYSPGTTRIVNGGRLRLKESDRLTATAEGLSRLGGKVTQVGDDLNIRGGNQLVGGTIDSFNDHRIAMAMAIAALNSKNGVTINGAEAVAKSYPHFFRELKRLGGDVRGIDLG